MNWWVFVKCEPKSSQLKEPKTWTTSVCVHWIYLIHEFHNLSWITEINELFHNILIYWDAPVNLVQAKDHWKIGESEHNTDCDVTVGITNSYAPNICIMYTSPCSRPAASRTIRSSAGIVKKQARTTAKMADHGNKCYVPGCAGDVKCRDGLVSVFRKAKKTNNAF